ncbi:Outer membrane protein OmpA [Colwellia chukchiensis]|uniref:Outer membrane protein OmpA n=1 Tax=Colwellia chukchiensis TaxID=641665 RepID=A0A1H7SUQ2_9GAMM|nr:OmpA family protein [Colwellia chukchiensis]SEL76340.1 Outer membrane protein OmpA [Colwellia chukchiensis]
MPSEAAQNPKDPAQQLETVRRLILGKDNSRVTQSIEKDARRIVSNVVTEALHDRQKQDHSVDKVLQPLIEQSVKQSVANNSEQMVSALYPLVGSLVRKSVAAFLSDFMEKTNQLLENSLTIKGLKWRLKARQSGVSYAQYVAAQTFVYRVEHVFLIHRETGLLLHSIALENENNSNADIVSAMLTAINDFVADSFLNDEAGQKEQLQEISTDNFNLIIKPGPSAFVVAAVSGQPPQRLSDQLQVVVENIHQLFFDELNNFSGDNSAFASSDALLRDCLLSEQKSTGSDKKKPPLFAWAIVMFVVILAGYQAIDWLKKNQLQQQVMLIEQQAGIIVKQLKINQLDDVSLDIWRDPDAIDIQQWLRNNGINEQNFKVTERRFYSLDDAILRARASRILSAYPDIIAHWQEQQLVLSGSLDYLQTEQLVQRLKSAGFDTDTNLTITKLQPPSTKPLVEALSIKQQLFDELVGRIATIQLSFAVASESIEPQMQTRLQKLYDYLQQLEPLAKSLKINYGLLILGSSDSSGSQAHNNIISIKRANNVAALLQQKGIAKEKIFVAGIGTVDIASISHATRSVMFNVMYTYQDGHVIR